MKSVIVFIASVIFLGACSGSESNQVTSEDMEKAEKAFFEMSESKREINCDIYSITTEEALTEKMRDSGDSAREAQAKWNVLEKEC